jgi:hypothetical protein
MLTLRRAKGMNKRMMGIAIIGLTFILSACSSTQTTEENTNSVGSIGTEVNEMEELNDKISYDIPDGLKQDIYSEDLVSCFAGYAFNGEQSVTELTNYAPTGWTVNGGVGINIGDAQAVYDGDELTGVINVMDNHTAEISDPYVTHTNESDVYVVEYSFDLLTAAEQEKYEEENGITLTEDESTSRYWYAYLCSTDSTDIYVAFLNADQYTEDEFMEFVSSISKR